MTHFHYQHGELYAENVRLTDIAERVGTPCYIYSRAALTENWHAFNNAFGNRPHRICYAVKANSNLAILNLFAQFDSGFDIVSQGELERVLTAKGDPQKIVFSGVGKTTDEILRALEVGIFCFNVESVAELHRIHALAKQQGKTAAISLRVNPNIDAKTHPYIATGLHENKFGIELSEVLTLCQQLKTLPELNLIGIACHIGSQLETMEPFLDALDCLLVLVQQLTTAGFQLQHIDIGGGLGIRYRDENPPTIQDYVAAICKKTAAFPQEIILEPGRAITANTGILLTRLEYIKQTAHKNFAIVDAAMNDLIRPALYEAWQDILPVKQPTTNASTHYDIVGPVCESADFLGKNRQLSLQPGELLAICQAGAYGFAMSSNYNSRPRVAEVMVDNDQFHIIRQRETIQDLFAHENIV